MFFFDMSVCRGHGSRKVFSHRSHRNRVRRLLSESLEQRALMASGQVGSLDGAFALTAGTTHVFQDDGLYSGTRDTTLRGDQPSNNFGAASKVEFDGQPGDVSLLKWDISRVPPGSQVTAAAIQLNITNTTSDAYAVYQLLLPWSELQANWTQAAGGTPWENAGALGSADRASRSLGYVEASQSGLTTLNLGPAGLAMVQQWIDNPQENYGITVQNFTNSDGAAFSSRETSTIALRPKLSITIGGDGSTLPPATNAAPSVDAGFDQTLLAPAIANLDATVSDDSLPAGTTLSATWSKLSGPGAVTFGNRTAIDTTASFSAAGTYVLRLSVTDGELLGTDLVTIQVNALASAGTIIRIAGEHHTQTLVNNPGNGAMLDFAGGSFFGLQNSYGLNTNWPDPVEFGHKSAVDHNTFPEASNLYPLSIKGTSRDFSIRGGVVQGELDPRAPWHVWKGLADGDGLRVEGNGTIDVSSVRIDNFEDGFSPHTASDDHLIGDVTYLLRDQYYTRIHDDMVENDAKHDIDISNSFMQGHTFYSMSGSANPDAVTTIKNVVVELVLQPHQGRISGQNFELKINESGGYPYSDGLGCGSIWKTDGGGKDGTISVENSVFLVPRASTSSMDSMRLDVAGITYRNVTVVWLGEGDYPGTVPAGVTITRDRSVFDNAKAAFFAAHPQFSEGSLVNNTAPYDSGAIISVYQPPSVQLPAELALASALAVVDTTVATQVEGAFNPNEGEDVNVSVEFADDEIPDALPVQVDDGLLDLLAVGEQDRDSDDILSDGLNFIE